MGFLFKEALCQRNNEWYLKADGDKLKLIQYNIFGKSVILDPLERLVSNITLIL